MEAAEGALLEAERLLHPRSRPLARQRQRQRRGQGDLAGGGGERGLRRRDDDAKAEAGGCLNLTGL